MSVPILYVQVYPDLAQTGADGSVAVCADDGTATHLSVLATVGGVLTFTLTSRGSAFTSGTYPNIPIVPTTGSGKSGSVTVGVSATGQITVVTPFNPGYNFQINDTFNLIGGAFSTASSVLGTMTVLTVLPCSPPFPINTKYVEIECDANGPAFITLDSTISSLGFTNGVLTTLQSTLTTVACRLASNERLLRRVTNYQLPVQGAGGAGFTNPIPFQVIMGTAAA